MDAGDSIGDREVAIAASSQLPGDVRGHKSHQIRQISRKYRLNTAAQPTSQGIPERSLVGILGRHHRLANAILVGPERGHTIELKAGIFAVNAGLDDILAADRLVESA